ncbi:hypothetical protein BH11VER1_BH11VER1_13460 [soil metagenome]
MKSALCLCSIGDKSYSLVVKANGYDHKQRCVYNESSATVSINVVP